MTQAQQETWAAVDRYIADLLLEPDPALDAALQACAEAGLPAINVSPPQGKLLHLVARMSGARNILEIGTLGGYSTIWLARALPPDGRLVTLELEEKHAAVARANLARAGVDQVVEIMVGRALDTLPSLASRDGEPFDLTFIDADKTSTAEYLEWAITLSRRGSVIIVDNVIRRGAVIDAASEDEGVRGIRRFNDLLAREKRVTASAIQTVGQKGYDGFALAVVTAR